MQNTNIDYWEKCLEAPTEEYRKFFRAEHEYLVENIPPNSKVLDIGCGEGRNMRSIFSVTKDVHGIDYDDNAVQHTLENFKDENTVTATQCDASELAFGDQIFDVVTHLMTLPNLEDNKVQSLKESARVLKDDGFIILSAFSDTAFDERMEIYKKVGVPIQKIEGTKVIFGGEGSATVISEQFSQQEIESLAQEAGLEVTEFNKIGKLCFLATLKKK